MHSDYVIAFALRLKFLAAVWRVERGAPQICQTPPENDGETYRIEGVVGVPDDAKYLV